MVGNLPKPTGQGEDANWINKSELVAGSSSMNSNGGIYSSGNGAINSSVSDAGPKFTAFSGSGNRLDGKVNGTNGGGAISGNMTEEEMIEQAIAMSIQEQQSPVASATAATTAAANVPKSAKEKMRAERMAALERRGLM